MIEFIEFAKSISSIGFPTLLLLILWGSYKSVWCWGKDLVKAEARADRWQDIALQSIGLAEKSVVIAKRT
jgi:hypothetical protein